MRVRLITLLCASLVACAAARAQETTAAGSQQPTPAPETSGVRPSEGRVPLAQVAVAFDVEGREALNARLRTQDLAGTPDAPVRNTRLVVENRGPVFYNYVAGWATFYGADGVRCGEGLWKLEAFAPNEQVEVDTPGLRLTCTPASWRVVATTLLTRSGDAAKPREGTPPPAETDAQTPAGASPATSPPPGVPPLEINVNGKTIPLQLGNPLEIVVGKERVRITVLPAP